MFDLYDLLAPRVYVVSEKRYEEALKAKKEEERRVLEGRVERLRASLAEAEEALKSLVD